MNSVKYILLINLLIISFLSSHAQSWQENKSYEGKFRVSTPSEMIEKIDSVKTEVGTLAYHTFFHQPDDPKTADNLFYMVSYVDYPEGTVHSDSLELLSDFFENTIESAKLAVDGNLIYASEVHYLDFPGRLWRIEYLEDKVMIKTQAFVKENRYYALQVISFKEKSLNKSSEEFFKSFSLF